MHNIQHIKNIENLQINNPRLKNKQGEKLWQDKIK